MSEMNRTSALVGSAAFFVLAPGTVAGLIPWLATHWRMGDGATPVTLQSDRWNLPRYICGWHWKSPETLRTILL